jgi:hypothetical protein
MAEWSGEIDVGKTGFFSVGKCIEKFCESGK